MIIKEITVRYETPYAEMIELASCSDTICKASATEKIEEEEGEW